MVSDMLRERLRWVLTALLAAEIAATVAIGLSARAVVWSRGRPADSARSLTLELRLTGLALGTESGFARQPALAVPADALWTHPAALDPFPAGSVIPPPDHVRRWAAVPGRTR